MTKLPPPAVYTPWSNGVYTVAPGLRALGVDFGNGEADRKLAQIDRDFWRYRENKLACLREARASHWLTEGLPPDVSADVFRHLATRMEEDYPAYFHWTGDVLYCGLTAERIALCEDGTLSPESIVPQGVQHPLEALALQIQPDLAIICREGNRDWAAALHVCAPSTWSPAEKIGKPFFATHAPVPGFEKVNAVAPRMVQALVEQGPFVRFVWGVASDDDLNHHPSLGIERGRFDRGLFWIRTERQTTLGMPEVGAAAFLIHVQTLPDSWVRERPELLCALREGLLSMTPEARMYKSVDRYWNELLALLDL